MDPIPINNDPKKYKFRCYEECEILEILVPKNPTVRKNVAYPITVFYTKGSKEVESDFFTLEGYNDKSDLSNRNSFDIVLK